MGWYSDKQNQQRLNDEAAREAFRIFTNQQTIYDSIRSKLVAGAEDADFLVIYGATIKWIHEIRSHELVVDITCSLQRGRMIKLGLIHTITAHASDKINPSLVVGYSILTPMGLRVYKRLEHAFRGTTFDPLWGRAAQAKKNMQIMTPKNDTYRKGIDNSIERKTDEQSLQSLVKGLRTVWSQRPRITRFTLRSWVYQWNIWLNGTAPDTPMIDWSAFSLPEWSDEDRKTQRQVWHDSDLLAFWLCPEGIDAGIEAHDEFLRICKKRGIKSDTKRKEVISEITGIAIPKPPKKEKAKDSKKASKAIDEIIGHLSALDDPNKEMIEVHQFGKPKFAVKIDNYDTEYFDSYDSAMKFTNKKQELITEKERIDAKRRNYNQKYLNTRYYY